MYDDYYVQIGKRTTGDQRSHEKMVNTAYVTLLKHQKPNSPLINKGIATFSAANTVVAAATAVPAGDAEVVRCLTLSVFSSGV